MASNKPGQVADSLQFFTSFYSFDYIEENKGFFSRLTALRSEKVHADVTLKVGEVSFPCHKIVLSAASPYFQSIFQEGREGNQDVLELKDINPEALGEIVDYIYTASKKITTENVKGLIKASIQFELDSLKKACDTFVSKLVHPGNCFGLFMFASQHQLESTSNVAKECMKTRLPDILHLASESEYQALDDDSLTQYIKWDDLEVVDEAHVFELVERWVKADAGNREPLTHSILQHVRLSYCSPVYFCSRVERSPMLSTEQNQELLNEAKTLKQKPHLKQSMETLRVQPRISFQRPLAIIGGPVSTCWWLKKTNNQWRKFSEHPGGEQQYHLAACVSGSSIVVTGGISAKQGNNPTNRCWQFSLAAMKWKALEPMRQARYGHAMVSVGDCIYVIGGAFGEDTSDVLKSVEKWESKSQKWVNVAEIVKGIKFLSAANIEGNIYVVGGFAIRMYNTVNDVWQHKVHTPELCPDVSLAVANNKIYVVGGSKKVCMRYDPQLDTWTELAKPLQGHPHCAAVAWMGKILLGGGEGSDNKIQEYDPAADQWKTSHLSLPMKSLSGHCMLQSDLFVKVAN